MPTYWKGHNIVHFAASKKHIGLYPGPVAVEEFAEVLKGYKTDKGTIRIPYGKVDAELIKKIVLWCYETGNCICHEHYHVQNTGAILKE